MLYTNDETRNNIWDDISDLSVLGTHFDRQSHTNHMVTAQTAQIYRIPEFLQKRILLPPEPPSHQHQKLSTRVSQENIISMVEHIPRNQNSDSNNFIRHLIEANTGIATQRRP